jgi:hypothetical protein
VWRIIGIDPDTGKPINSANASSPGGF